MELPPHVLVLILTFCGHVLSTAFAFVSPYRSISARKRECLILDMEVLKCSSVAGGREEAGLSMGFLEPK